jgi:hypothetical protein
MQLLHYSIYKKLGPCREPSPQAGIAVTAMQQDTALEFARVGLISWVKDQA